MSAPIRVIDTGLKPARWNTAMTAALAELHRAGSIPDTLRFQRFERCVLVGRHQDLAHEVDLERCRERGIQTARRMTGGGAIYADPGILSWEIVCGRFRLGRSCRRAAELICRGVAEGLARLGLPARFRGPDDIEVDGRKIGGAAGYFDGPTFVYQGTIWADLDLAEMAEVLRLPFRSLDEHGLRHLAGRVTSVTAARGRSIPMQDLQAAIIGSLSTCLGFSFVRERPSSRELDRAERIHAAEYATDGFVLGSDSSPAVARPGSAAARRKLQRRPNKITVQEVHSS